MPNVFLDPIQEKDAAGNPTGKVTDPAADVMAYLLSVPTRLEAGGASAAAAAYAGRDERAQRSDDRVAVGVVPAAASRAICEGRHSDKSLESRVKVDERVLVGRFQNDPNDRAQRQLEYVARRSISRYGCFGCHDIPGYETAKPIGTPLASWGRKDPSQLAFENIGEFLTTHGEYMPTRKHGQHAWRRQAASPRHAASAVRALAANPGDHAARRA